MFGHGCIDLGHDCVRSKRNFIQVLSIAISLKILSHVLCQCTRRKDSQVRKLRKETNPVLQTTTFLISNRTILEGTIYLAKVDSSARTFITPLVLSTINDAGRTAPTEALTMATRHGI